MNFYGFSKFGINFWNYLNERGNGKGLNGAWAVSSPWPQPVEHGNPRNGGAPACWRGFAHRGGQPERCLAPRTTLLVSWSPRTRRASGTATDDGSDGEVRHNSQNELQ
jgi:hypothetical protein